jgi:zinc protease
VPIAARPLTETPPLAVVKVPTANKAVVSVRLVFRVGSKHDPAGKEGLTALATHLLVEGGTQKLSAAELTDALYPMAAELSADVDKELTVIQGRVHLDKLDRFLELLGDVLLEPRLDAKEFDRLKSEQKNALTKQLRNENDEELGKVVLDSLLYEGHPYRHPALGTEEGLAAITLTDVKKHLKDSFTQARLIVGVAGPVDDALVERVKTKARLTSLPATGPAPAADPSASGVRGQTVIVRRNTDSTAGSFGFSVGFNRADPDFVAVMLGVSYLGEHRQEHGLLFQELRDKRGLNYGTYAYAEHYRQDGWDSIPKPNVRRAVEDFSLWLRPVEAKNGVFATRAALWGLKKVLDEPLPAEQLETAKGFLVGATRVWTLTDQRRLGWAIDDLLRGTQDFPARVRQEVPNLTAEQVQAALKKALDPARLNFVFVTRDADGLAQALTTGAKSPITYASLKPEAVLKDDAVIEAFPLPMKSASTHVIDAFDVMRH